MGSCVSVHKDSDSLTKLRFSIGSRNEKLLIPSPVKEKPLSVNAGDRTAADVAVTSPARYTSVGSKDEAFFDSQPWLESDCEDDFVSVNGDLSSSRGNTPVHVESSSVGKPLVNKLGLEEGNGSVGEAAAAPLDKKKRLSELFKESLGDDEQDKSAPTTLAQQLNSPHSNSGSGGSSHNGVGVGMVREEEEESLRSPQCCLPKLLSTRSFNDTRKSHSQRTSPAPNAAAASSH